MAQSIKRPQFLWVLLSLAIGATLLLVACGSGASNAAGNAARQPAASAQIVHVSMVENNGRYAFSPAVITIPKGTQVVWTNGSDAAHTVTSNGNTFASSGLLSEKQSFAATFPNAGTFAYHCTVHSYMMGTIIVR